MLNSTMRTFRGRMLVATLGIFMMALGINLFTTPLHLYTNGLVGYAQLIRTVLDERMGIRFAGIDIAGILYYLFNIPIIAVVYKSLGKSFLLRTLVFTLLFSAATTLIPIPEVPLVDDTLTAILIGSILVGVGDGLVLTCGCSIGGVDMLGVFFSKKRGIPVGQFGMYANILLFVACFLLFNFSITAYSVIYMMFTNMIIDRMHQQSISVQALIFTKDHSGTISRTVMQEMGRGVTYWEGAGAYTDEPSRILCTCISRYEQEQLERIVKATDPRAFIITIPGVHIDGNFIHKV